MSFVALLLALACLAYAAWRAAAALGADGALRIVAAAPLGAAAAAASVLILGRFGLSGSQPLLVAIAVGLAAFAWRALPRPAPRKWAPSPGERLAVGAGAGVAVAWAAWAVRHPSLGTDPLGYHLPIAIAWAQQGDAGAVRDFSYVFPVGNYPLLDETLVSWILSLGRSLAVANLWAPAMWALTGLAGAVGLRRAGVGPVATALALVAILAIPIWTALLIGPHTDLGALAWLTCTATLAAAARSHPKLLVPAVLAAGLAIGTKTTTAPLLLAVTVLLVRPPLPPARILLPAAAVAAVIGGLWYLRNWVEHGSPLWPFVATPGADPLPPLFTAIDATFMDTVDASLTDGRGQAYWELLGATPLLLLAAPVLALVAGSRRAVLAAAVALVAALIWSRAPFTGRAADPLLDFSLTTVRYLVPALAAAAVALCLASADGGPRTQRAVRVVLGAVALLSAWRALELGFPEVPALSTVALGAIAGAVAARLAPRLAVPAAAAALAAVAIASTDGYLERHAQNLRLASQPVNAWLAGQPDGDDPVHGAPQAFGTLAGERLQHELNFIPRDERCPEVLARRGWVVIGASPPSPYLPEFTADDCLADLPPVYEDPAYRVYDRRQTAITSSTSSSPSSTTEKSSSVISPAAASGSVRALRSRTS